MSLLVGSYHPRSWWPWVKLMSDLWKMHALDIQVSSGGWDVHHEQLVFLTIGTAPIFVNMLSHLVDLWNNSPHATSGRSYNGSTWRSVASPCSIDT